MIVIDISDIVQLYYMYYKEDDVFIQDNDCWFVFNNPYPLQEVEIKEIYSKCQITTLNEKHLLKHNEPFPINFVSYIEKHITRRIYKRSIDKKARKSLIKHKPEIYHFLCNTENFSDNMFYVMLDDLIDKKVNDILIYYEYIKNYILDLKIVNNILFVKRTINVYQMLFDYINND